MNKKQIDFLNRYGINIDPNKTFGELAIIALKNFSNDRKCLSNIYTKSSDKYTWECTTCSHIWEANWNNTLKGRGCPRCTNKTVLIEDLKKAAITKGGELLSKEYYTCDTKYTWKCLKGHTWKTSWDLVKQGNWCPKCAKVSPPTDDKILGIISDKGGEWLEGVYENNRSKLRIRCCNDHIFSICWKDLNSGNWCKTCSKTGISNTEKEIAAYLPNPIMNYRPDFLDNKELDMYLPEQKVAIEYHGLIWHSSRFIQDSSKLKYSHRDKFIKCSEQGIKLVQIFGDEWKNKKNIVLSVLRNKIGEVSRKINARECNIRTLDKTEEKQFFTENHISGYTKSEKCYGLFFGEELISAISFRKPFTKKYNNYIEIARFASKLNTVVRGGFSKLMKYAKKYTSTFKGILTYSDLRFGTGEVYLQNGFTKIGRTPPNYYYVNNKGERENRFKHRKNNDLEYIRKWGSTEIEQNLNQGWYRIYDAGSNIYIKN